MTVHLTPGGFEYESPDEPEALMATHGHPLPQPDGRSLAFVIARLDQQIEQLSDELDHARADNGKLVEHIQVLRRRLAAAEATIDTLVEAREKDRRAAAAADAGPGTRESEETPDADADALAE